MSRREDRHSYSARTRSRFEREPSPKRLRGYREREEKRTIDRSYYPKNQNSNNSKDSESKVDRASDPREFARSKFYFQHDEQGKGGQVHVRHETDNARKRDLKESKSEDKSNEKINEKLNEKKNKRPSFSESKKIKEPESNSLNGAKKEERKPFNHHGFERRGGFGRGFRNRNENGNGNLGFRGWGQIRVQERFGGARIGDGNRRKEGVRNEVVGSEKWKHDMYEELNKRSPLNEEERISKIESLLAS